MPARFLILLSCSLLAWSVQVRAEAVTPGQWLVEAAQAARTGSYQGVIVYRGDNVLETFRVTHRFAEGSERERIQSMTGEVREILKQNEKLTCLLPKDRRLTVRRGKGPTGLFLSINPQTLAQIGNAYEFKELGRARVAGRLCRGIAIKPRDAFRYGYEVWADAESAVPLKLSLVSPQGNLLEQMFFTEVNFPSEIPDSAFESDAPIDQLRQSSEQAVDALAAAHEQEPVDTGAAAAPVQTRQATFSKLPPGFRVVRRRIIATPQGAREHVILSDGLAAVSVYRTVSRQGAGSPDSQPRLDRMGPLHAYRLPLGQMQITVVGEAPGATIRMIGDNLEAAERAQDQAEALQAADAPQ